MPEPQPLIFRNALIELNGVEIHCLASHLGLVPDTDSQDFTSFCGPRSYPGATTWTMNLTVAQSYDEGGTDEVLRACLAADGPVEYRIVPNRNRPVSATNPEYSGTVIPAPYAPFDADAGEIVTIELEWSLEGEPTRSDGTINGAALAATSTTTTTSTAAA